MIFLDIEKTRTFIVKNYILNKSKFGHYLGLNYLNVEEQFNRKE